MVVRSPLRVDAPITGQRATRSPADMAIVTGLDDMVVKVSEMRETTMRHWREATVTLLIAALAGASSAILASRPAPVQNIVKFELWSRQDPSGPLRPANVVKAAERLNKDIAAESSVKRGEV